MKTGNIRTVAKLSVFLFTIMVITMWTYHPTTKNLFAWDTNGYLYIHEFWISKLSVPHIIWMFLSLEFMNWHPLTWLSWAVDYQVYGGFDTWGYHLSNNIFHSINSSLLFVLMLVLFGLNQWEPGRYPFRQDAPALSAAFLAALLFAVHPQHVESVAWVAERKDLLCQLFLLLAMLAYVKYVTCDEDVRKRWFRGTMVLFAMALLSKPMAVTFPVVLLLVDVYPLRRADFMQPLRHSYTQHSIPGLLREKVPFFLLSAFSVLITLYAQQGALSNFSFDLRILNAFNSIVLYLTKLLLPLDLAPLYPFSVTASENISWKDFVPVLGVIGLTLAALFAWFRGRHVWLVAWLFYLVTLSPVLGLIQVGLQGAADRYAYLPTLPVYVLMGAALLTVFSKANSTKTILVWLAVLPVIFLLADKTRQQIQVWENNETLWTYAITQFPTSALAHMNLGGHYFNIQDYDKAAYYFRESGRLNPRDPKVIAWLGLTDLHLGRYEDALNSHIALGSALEDNRGVKANQYCIQYNIGWIFAQMDMFVESRELFSRVSSDSDQGADARVWLDWLGASKQAGDKSLEKENLPGFCNKLIPSI